MRFLLLTIVLISTKAFSQSPALPLWQTKEIEFSCSEMKVKDESTTAVIFDGRKDSYLKLTDNSRKIINSVVSVKLPGYFEMKNGIVSKCEFKITEDSKSITYTAWEDLKLCVIIISYGVDSNTPSFIIVSTNDNWKIKTSNRLTFTLDGIK